MADLEDSGEPNPAMHVNPYIGRCCKRRARKRPARHLPQEIVFDVLLHVPAQVLRDVMRHVCREWNLMIRSPNFTHHHLRNSSSGIIIQPRFSTRDVIYTEMRRGCLEISKLGCAFGGLIATSCNGLVLVPDLSDRRILHFLNPLTRQRLTLPPYFHETGFYPRLGLAFVEVSMAYKAVSGCGTLPFGLQKEIAVLTIGVDRFWRRIDVEHLSQTARRALSYVPLVTGGYMHWIGETFILTLNVHTETFCQFSVPELISIPRSRKRCRHFLPMGCNLSIVHKSRRFLMDVWEMNPETGEWTLLLSFDLKPLKYKFKGWFLKYERIIIPIGWLVVKEVLVFSCSQRRYVAYNFKTGEIQWFELDAGAKSYEFKAHVNSMVWLGGEFEVDRQGMK